jgi:hypothetical protein
MFSFFKKHSLMINVLGALVFGWGAVEKILEYSGPDGNAIDLFGAIIFGIMSLVKLTDVMGHLRKKKQAWRELTK